MRIARVKAPPVGEDPPTWPPLLATRGLGERSAMHAHHAMHVVAAVTGTVRIQIARAWQTAAGVITPPDVAHAIDATGTEIVLVYFDPESVIGASLAATLGGRVRLLERAEVDAIEADDPFAIMGDDGVAFAQRLAAAIGAGASTPPTRIHPRVRAALRHIAAAPADRLPSLDDLADKLAMSPSRLMHVFTESIGIPLRPYLAWLKAQRAAAAIAGGASMTAAAHAAGFSDAAHMTRTFRRMFGMAPSAIRRIAAS